MRPEPVTPWRRQLALLSYRSLVNFCPRMTAPSPTSVRRLANASIEVRWSDGHLSIYPNRYLRENCPCAGCREGKPLRFHLPVLGGAATELAAVQINVVGRYAIGIQWSDRHDSGIYSYETLRQLCPCETCQPASKEVTSP